MAARRAAGATPPRPAAQHRAWATMVAVATERRDPATPVAASAGSLNAASSHRYETLAASSAAAVKLATANGSIRAVRTLADGGSTSRRFPNPNF